VRKSTQHQQHLWPRTVRSSVAIEKSLLDSRGPAPQNLWCRRPMGPRSIVEALDREARGANDASDVTGQQHHRTKRLGNSAPTASTIEAPYSSYALANTRGLSPGHAPVGAPVVDAEVWKDCSNPLRCCTFHRRASTSSEVVRTSASARRRRTSRLATEPAAAVGARLARRAPGQARCERSDARRLADSSSWPGM